MTDAMRQVVWSASQTPFGKMQVNEDVDGDGQSISLNLRFPGQYFDRETGLHYNYHRYYDPNIGRYITSDPIGLEGGLNTYTYVSGNPVNFYDPYGLELVLSPQTIPIIIGSGASTAVGAAAGASGIIAGVWVNPVGQGSDIVPGQPYPPPPIPLAPRPMLDPDLGPQYDEDGESCEPGYDHGGGRNAKHSNPDRRAAAEKKWLDAKRRLENAKRRGASKAEKEKIKKEIKHWKDKMDESGGHHGQKPKGPRNR